MKITRIQFIHAPPFIDGMVASRYVVVDPKRGIAGMEYRAPFVCLSLTNGEEMLVPEDALYITRAPEPGNYAVRYVEEPEAAEKPKRKHVRTRPLEEPSFSPPVDVVD